MTEAIADDVMSVIEGWEITSLRDIILDAQTGFASGQRDESGILQLRMNNITTDGRVLLDSYLKVPISQDINKYLLKSGDILFNNTNSVDLIGKTALFKNECKNCTFSNHITRIRVNENKIVPEWLLYHLVKLWQSGYFSQICARHVGQAGIRNDQVLKISIPLPPLPEQHHIASILTTVDDAIQRSRQAAAETERLKAGVMQELMTKGIGHTEFKEDDVLGNIPIEWDAVKFESAMIHPPNNGIWKNQETPTDGYRLVRMTEFFKGDILDTNCSATITLTEEESKRYSLDSGDLLFGRRSLNVEGAGKCVLVPEIKKPLIFESSLIRVALNKEIAYPLFFLYFMNGKGRDQISKMVRKVSVSGITGKDLQNMIIPLPPITEQQNITIILKTIDRKLSLQRQRTAQYERLKQGLMNELLTGNRRVQVV